MKKRLKVSAAAGFLGIAKGTLRQYADNGVIPCHVLPSGHRYFEIDDLTKFLKGELDTNKEKETSKKAYIYARVSTKKQADSGNLDRQITRLVEYGLSKEYEISYIFKEIASGINENRRELTKLLDELNKNKGSILLIEYKDRLARFGYRYIEKYIQDSGCFIDVMEEVEKDDEKELVEDLITITTSFSARIYGKRGGKKVSDNIKKVVKTAEKED